MFSTATKPSCSATHLGVEPVPTRARSAREPSAPTAKTLTSPLPPLVTNECRPSRVSTTYPCD